MVQSVSGGYKLDLKVRFHSNMPSVIRFHQYVLKTCTYFDIYINVFSCYTWKFEPILLLFCWALFWAPSISHWALSGRFLVPFWAPCSLRIWQHCKGTASKVPSLWTAKHGNISGERERDARVVLASHLTTPVCGRCAKRKSAFVQSQRFVGSEVWASARRRWVSECTEGTHMCTGHRVLCPRVYVGIIEVDWNERGNTLIFRMQVCKAWLVTCTETHLLRGDLQN